MLTIRTRIVMLLALFSVAFIGGLCYWQVSDRQRLTQLSTQAAKDHENYVTRIVNLKGASLITLAADYTVWDDMCKFVRTRDKKWGVVNLDEALSTYDTDASWVYDTRMRPTYGSSPSLPKLNVCPIPPAKLTLLFRNHGSVHFFCNSAVGILEISGYPIHASADRQRRGRIFGYYLVGRLWDRDVLTTLSNLTGSNAYLAHASTHGRLIDCEVSPDGTVLYTRQLTDPDGVPIKALHVRIDSHIVRLLRESNSTTLTLVMWFTLMSLGILFVCLLKWVSLPLRCIVTTLRTKRLEDIHNLEESSSEFGEVARLVHDFFAQQQTLLEEIAERTRAEEELEVARDELEERVAARTRQLAEAYDSTIEGWSRALDLRDQETEGHCRRVTEMTLKLARAIHMSERQLVDVRRGALLHDIGKMGIPDSILLKPGPLTDEEWIVMRKHPDYAFELLSPIEFLRPALAIPWCHHEKWDGTGYPRGLKGDEIPLEARLFCIVDVWDALRSDRPYRKGWPEDRIIDHIRSLEGTHFEPFAVELFIRILTGEDDDTCDIYARSIAA